MSEKIKIEIIYALPTQQDRLTLELPAGSTAAQALQQSGFIAKHHLDIQHLQCGVFSRLIPWEEPLQDQDRLELYRPLSSDPRQKRLSKVKRKLPRRCV